MRKWRHVQIGSKHAPEKYINFSRRTWFWPLDSSHNSHVRRGIRWCRRIVAPRGIGRAGVALGHEGHLKRSLRCRICPQESEPHKTDVYCKIKDHSKNPEILLYVYVCRSNVRHMSCNQWHFLLVKTAFPRCKMHMKTGKQLQLMRVHKQ